jgi:hypothetical protein
MIFEKLAHDVFTLKILHRLPRQWREICSVEIGGSSLFIEIAVEETSVSIVRLLFHNYCQGQGNSTRCL